MSRHSSTENLILSSEARIQIGDPTVGEAGWRDMLGQIVTRRAAGAGVPVYEQLGASPFYGYNFALNDSVQVNYHIDHDFCVGTSVFVHAHWAKNGTNVQPVRWQIDWMYANGHQRGVFPVTGGWETVTVTQTPESPAWTHQIAEISAGIEPAEGFEVDGMLICVFTRITNGATNNTDKVYLLFGDCHYQADRFSTKNRSPNFYA
jgi:hypothetical protein